MSRLLTGTGIWGATALLAMVSGAPASAQATGFHITGCSLSCSSGSGGSAVTCGTTSIHVNEELRVSFSAAVDLASLNSTTFSVTNVSTGTTPPGTTFLDPGDPTTVVFRPQLTFDSGGNPIFGFAFGGTYAIHLPGTALDPGPYLQDLAGNDLTSPMNCVVTADLGIQNAVPGPPSVQAVVDVVAGYDPITHQPSVFRFDVPLDGATDVWRGSEIRLHFDDLMNPATLVNPVTGTSPTIQVLLDLDGDLLTSADRQPWPGDWSVLLDQDQKTTQVVYSPDSAYPSSGPAPHRKVVLVIDPAVSDLAGNPLVNAGTSSFTAELVRFGVVEMREDFAMLDAEDAPSSGALWGGGLLLPGKGGGAGVLGPLVLSPGVVLELDTASASFTSPDVVNLGSVDPPPGTFPTVDVLDGVFEFSRVMVPPGSEVVLGGDHAARILARGDLDVFGGLSLSGGTNDPHLSDQPLGGPGGLAGPGGGAGGQGADRPDNSNQPDLIAVGGLVNPGAQTHGQDGGGIFGAAPGVGAGPGGIQWPTVLPDGVEQAKWQGLDLSNTLNCSSEQLGAGGGGAGYATAGGDGKTVAPILLGFPGPLVPTPDTGGAAAAPLDVAWRTLDPEAGYLRGGSGGGGGGVGLHLTRSNGTPLNCGLPMLGAPGLVIATYATHSAGGGGGGGGAAQVHSGRRARVEGTIDGRGGDGTDSFLIFLPGSTVDRDRSAAPGGGGSGGAVLLQSPDLVLAPSPARIDVSGGEGGTGAGTTGIGGGDKSRGGDGGTGLVRVESDVVLDVASVAGSVAPYDPGTDPLSSTHLSVGPFTVQMSGPTARSGALSCWWQPEVNFYELEFADDSSGRPGWNMFVIPTAGGPSFPWRGAMTTGGGTLEELLGSDVGGPNPSPIAVRFQGVRLVSPASGGGCDLDLDDPAVALPGSRTGWVRHPAELNTYWDHLGPAQAALLRPNALRYQVIFDKNSPYLPELLSGVSELFVRVFPR